MGNNAWRCRTGPRHKGRRGGGGKREIEEGRGQLRETRVASNRDCRAAVPNDGIGMVELSKGNIRGSASDLISQSPSSSLLASRPRTFTGMHPMYSIHRLQGGDHNADLGLIHLDFSPPTILK